jgi:hypothetical protein
MEVIAKRPIYVRGAVMVEGVQFETTEQHARELVQKGYAMAPQADGAPEGDQPPAARIRKPRAT